MSLQSTSPYREQSLIEVMERCGGFLFVFLKGLCGDAGMAEDLLQKLWIYVFEHFEEKDFGHIGYLKRKAFQLYVDEMRKKDSRPVVQRYEDLPENSALDHPKEPSNSMEELRLYEDFWGQFESLHLNEPDKSLFWYHVRFGYTVKEVGEKFSMAKSTAHDRIRDIRQKCMNFLQS